MIFKKTKIDWVWIGYGLGMDWVWIGYGLGMDWVWIGYGLGMDWVVCNKYMKNISIILKLFKFYEEF
jgi:hypothetical protein